MCFQNVPDYDVEHSEVLLYYIRVLENRGEFSDALNQLDIFIKERSVVDRTAIAESRGRSHSYSLDFICLFYLFYSF